MTDFELSRRKMLAGLGAVGAASTGAGYGATAFLSDREAFGNDRFVAGSLDLKVGWEEHYADAIPDSIDAVAPGGDVPTDYVGFPDPSAPVVYVAPDDVTSLMDLTQVAQFPEGGLGDADPCVALGDVPDDQLAPLFEFDDVKPGDFGEATFTLALCDNPGYVWLRGTLQNESENVVTEPEADSPAERPGVELTDEIRTVLWYDEDCDNVLDDADSVVFRGSLREFLTRAESGLLLDGNPGAGGIDCFPGTASRCLGFAWWLPSDVGNEVQTDSVTFDLGFYTEQCRHNMLGGGPDISFVAFCVEEGRSVDLSADDLTLTYDDSNGAPSMLSWETDDLGISTVVVKAGRCGNTGGTTTPEVEGMTNYYANGATAGDVVSCLGEPADADAQCPSSPAPDGEQTVLKLDYEGGSFAPDSTNDTCQQGSGGGPPGGKNVK